MTLIVAIPASDGVVFGSDSQVTTGEIRASSTKILKLNDNALWSASGELALIQRVEEGINALTNRNLPLMQIRDELGQIVKNAVQALVLLDFRTQFAPTDPNWLLGLHSGDFLFVERRDGKNSVLHVLINGTPEWVVDRCATTGNGAPFAHVLLHKYQSVPLGCDRATVLAYKVIEEAIQVGAYGLGPPIDIWKVTDKGVKNLSKGETAALEDTTRILRNREIDFLKEGIKPTQAAVPDTGASREPRLPPEFVELLVPSENK